MRFSFLRPALLLLSLACSLQAAPGRRVVLIVWDGMRPDFITPQTTPTLWALAQHGVFFQNQHSAFVTSTEVNGTTFGSGAYPRNSGIMANKEFRPAINAHAPVAMEAPKNIRRGDAVTGGHYVAVPTAAEILRAQPSPFRTVVAGSKPVAWLLDRGIRTDPSSPIVAEGQTQPEALQAQLTAKFGPFPPIHQTKIDRDRWTTTVLLEQFWHDDVPPYSVLWLAEPDWTQHETGPGSPTTLQAIRSSDDNLKRVLTALDQKGLLADTDVIVASDHGVSTIERKVDLAADLAKAGLSTARTLPDQPANGTVLVVGNGGSANLYVIGHDAAVIDRAIDFLEQQNYTAVLFTKDGRNGTFPLSLAKVDSKNAPDIVVTLRWSDARSPNGTPGMLISEAGAGRGPGQGMHASLSRFDEHNTLVASGPDFRRGIRDPLPTGTIDVAPTILWLLGVPAAPTMNGRVLTEALTIPGPKLESFDTTRHEASRDVDGHHWAQYLVVSQVNGVSYFDEGNSETPVQ